jgi:hypothetical protein
MRIAECGLTRRSQNIGKILGLMITEFIPQSAIRNPHFPAISLLKSLSLRPLVQHWFGPSPGRSVLFGSSRSMVMVI